jgi:hypothetical protein
MKKITLFSYLISGPFAYYKYGYLRKEGERLQIDKLCRAKNGLPKLIVFVWERYEESDFLSRLASTYRKWYIAWTMMFFGRVMVMSTQYLGGIGIGKITY